MLATSGAPGSTSSSRPRITATRGEHADPGDSPHRCQDTVSRQRTARSDRPASCRCARPGPRCSTPVTADTVASACRCSGQRSAGRGRSCRPLVIPDTVNARAPCVSGKLRIDDRVRRRYDAEVVRTARVAGERQVGVRCTGEWQPVEEHPGRHHRIDEAIPRAGAAKPPPNMPCSISGYGCPGAHRRRGLGARRDVAVDWVVASVASCWPTQLGSRSRLLITDGRGHADRGLVRGVHAIAFGAPSMQPAVEPIRHA